MERYFKVMSCKLVKWQVYLHGIFMAIQVMIPDAFFANIDKLILKFIWKFKKPSVAKTILKKEEQAEGFTHPDFRTYYKAVVIKTHRSMK